MDAFRRVVQQAAAAAEKVAKSAQAKVTELKAVPTHIRCSACPQQMAIPPAAFNWICNSGHLNAERTPTCIVCASPAPVLPNPCVACPHCHTITAIPSSNMRKEMRETQTKTKEYVERMKATPVNFHCAHCNTLLAVPVGPWTCQTCNSENVDECKKCWQCSQKKTMQRAICGVCRASTPISTTNFSDSLKSGAKSVAMSSKKVYYDIAGTPYVTCGMCRANVSLEKKDGSPATPLLADHQHQAGEGSEGISSVAAAAGPAMPPGGLQQYHSEGIQCPQCHNPIQ